MNQETIYIKSTCVHGVVEKFPIKKPDTTDLDVMQLYVKEEVKKISELMTSRPTPGCTECLKKAS